MQSSSKENSSSKLDFNDPSRTKYNTETSTSGKPINTNLPIGYTPTGAIHRVDSQMDWAAENQSWSEQAFNATSEIFQSSLVNAGTNVLGYAVGVSDAITYWNINKLADNFVFEEGIKINERISDRNPIYITEAETAQIKLDNLTPKLWWSYHGIGGLSVLFLFVFIPKCYRYIKKLI